MRSIRLLALLFLCALGCAVTAPANAAVIFSTGSAVSSPQHSATFNTFTTNGPSLLNYTEGGLRISVNDTRAVGFNVFRDAQTTQYYYASGGNFSWVTITPVANVDFTDLSFKLGDGFILSTSPSPLDAFSNFRYEAFLNGVSQGPSVLVNLFKPSIVRFTGLFDELRVASYQPSQMNANSNGFNFGNFQAIALDNVFATVTPEPASLALWGAGALGLAVVVRRRKRSVT